MKLWSLKGIDILVVDDFPSMRSMMISMLKAYGADTIRQASNGKEAILRIEEKTPELVMCDYNLGEGQDGQEVLEEAKEKNLLPYSSIFFLVTAENTNLMVMGAMDYRPDDYLVKPFTKDILQARVRKVQARKSGMNHISNAIVAKKYSKALSLIEVELQKNGPNKLELMRLKGEMLQKNMDYDGAQILYEEVLDIREIAWAQFGLGVSLYYQKELDSALDLFEDIIQANSNFLLAYDWIAKIEKSLGDDTRAQEMLERAVKLSPKGVRRQQELAEVALANNDLKVAQTAYTVVLKTGSNSCYRSPNDYGGLAKVYAAQSQNDEASKLIEDMKKEYKNADPATQLQTAVLEGVVSHSIGDEDKSKAAIERAMKLYERNPDKLSSNQAMDMAKTCFELGEKDNASEFMKHVVRNQNENTETMNEAKALFKKYDMDDVGQELMSATNKEIIDVNNQGVALVKEGKLRESIRLFQQAARAMSENTTVNLNAAHSLLMMMKSKGPNEQHLSQTREYLDRVRLVDAKNKRYTELLARYKTFSG